MSFWGTFFTVALVMLISSVLTATFIVAGIEYLCEKKIGRKVNEKKNNNNNSDSNITK